MLFCISTGLHILFNIQEGLYVKYTMDDIESKKMIKCFVTIISQRRLNHLFTAFFHYIILI